MNDQQFSTPIVLIIFNRPDTTARVFHKIAKIKPSKLLVIADGARANKKGEVDLVMETRAIISHVNWPCQVRTNYSEINLGCKLRVASGLDWVFSLESEAIILEDDCLPSDSFFQFCDEMLDRYRGNKSIGMIGGINFQPSEVRAASDYFFSKYTHIWGWATWADRWAGAYDVDIKGWPKVKTEKALKNTLSSIGELKYWEAIFDRVHSNQIDTWDYQWVFANWISNRLNILPSVNLISNIGFGDDATHTKGYSELANLPLEDLAFPLRHPDKIKVNVTADKYMDRLCYRRPLYRRLIGKLRRFISTTKFGLIK
jgi:hypothetical protein